MKLNILSVAGLPSANQHLDSFSVLHFKIVFFELGIYLIGNGLFRTPMIASMHEDDSPNLTEVARILRDTLQVKSPLFHLPFAIQMF